MSDFPSLAGQLLLAMPGIGDPRFDHAVIAMCAHDEQGALGIGIGDTLEGVGLHALMQQLDIDPGAVADAPVHIGGPVEMQRGFVLHSLDWAGEDTLKVQPTWGLTSTLDVLRAIAAGEGPRDWLVALGYAGWSAGQLDDEMCRHGWFSAPASEALLFRTGPRQRWRAAFEGVGIDPALLAAGAGTA
ncbi:YqgE/AlgH family protein [Sphingomonas naphthae]|uniref:UPF0301 protein PQ455_03980 n=1 Tax=Sphingomonas naphthae TaxID=1813468 RepID=A0ABY7TP38_9SPHN|nr:YqgE/AlgH family protein [Sphingomonas naphthae]WCT74397.1 YqgE/AlgH family protein [Sphingomonas naphthae]